MQRRVSVKQINAHRHKDKNRQVKDVIIDRVTQCRKCEAGHDVQAASLLLILLA